MRLDLSSRLHIPGGVPPRCSPSSRSPSRSACRGFTDRIREHGLLVLVTLTHGLERVILTTHMTCGNDHLGVTHTQCPVTEFVKRVRVTSGELVRVRELSFYGVFAEVQGTSEFCTDRTIRELRRRSTRHRLPVNDGGVQIRGKRDRTLRRTAVLGRHLQHDAATRSVQAATRRNRVRADGVGSSCRVPDRAPSLS